MTIILFPSSGDTWEMGADMYKMKWERIITKFKIVDVHAD